MVKDCILERRAQGITAEQYFKLIYESAQFIQSYHKEVNRDANAKVSAWVNGNRIVTFVMPMNVPAMLKKFIGSESIPVKETQVVSKHGTSKFTVKSDPLLDFPGASTFSTSGEVTVCDAPGGCKVQILMKCTAGIPWPMQSTVENLMVQEAQQSLGLFLDKCISYCLENVHTLKQTPIVHATVPQPVMSDEGDMFYDAAEDMLLVTGDDDLPAAAGELTPYQPARLEDIIVACLRRIEQNSSETVKLLESLEQQLAKLNDDMHSVRNYVVPRQYSSSKAGSSYSWMYWGCFAAAATSGFALYYWRHKQRASL